MTLEKIIVKGLFGIFYHQIHLNKGGIAIVIGENGIGKTTILQIINSIFNKNLDFLFNVDFASIDLFFSDNIIISISKEKDDILKINEYPTRNTQQIKLKIKGHRRFIPPFLIRVGENEWLDRRTEQILLREDIIKLYGIDPISKAEKIPEWLEKAVESNKVKLIQTQRLYKPISEPGRGSRDLEFMVKTYSSELVDLLLKNDALFTTKSIQLDSTFPMRLLDHIKQSKNENRIRQIVKDINRLAEYRLLLSDVGIINRQEDDIINKSLESINDPNDLSILELYIIDNKEKLDVFKETAKKLKLLLRIVNSRFKHKQLCIDKKTGFVIKSKYDERTISVDKLSSGEQNELIIFYNLLFKTNKDDIVLIDEPEISLHIVWQQRLIGDLKEIAEETGISMLISTHSPDIIGDNWSLVQTLSGKE